MSLKNMYFPVDRCIYGNKFFPFRVSPFQKGDRTVLIELPPLKVYSFPLNDQFHLTTWGYVWIYSANTDLFCSGLLVQIFRVNMTPLQNITKTRLFKYIENFISKNWKFSDKKNTDIFHISAQNIDCGYSLEPPRWGGSNEYPKSMFWTEIWKIMYTPVNPSFTI